MEKAEKISLIIKEKLSRAFAPESLAITDESSKHKGHSGFKEGGETHFHVEIISEKFEGISMVARQRLIYNALKKEMDGPIHALSIKAVAPSEADK